MDINKIWLQEKNIYIKIKKGKKDLKIFALIYKTRVAFLKYLFFFIRFESIYLIIYLQLDLFELKIKQKGVSNSGGV